MMMDNLLSPLHPSWNSDNRLREWECEAEGAQNQWNSPVSLTEGLDWHGNLLGLCLEGGEHTHQPHSCK